MAVAWIVRVCLPGEDDVVLPFEEDEGVRLGEFLADTARTIPEVDVFVEWLHPHPLTR